jgi:hypothetical protein
MGTQRRDQPLGREVLGRQSLVHVGRSCIPPGALTIACAAAGTFGIQPQRPQFSGLGGSMLPLSPQQAAKSLRFEIIRPTLGFVVRPFGAIAYCAPTFTPMRVGSIRHRVPYMYGALHFMAC